MYAGSLWIGLGRTLFQTSRKDFDETKKQTKTPGQEIDVSLGFVFRSITPIKGG